MYTLVHFIRIKKKHSQPTQLNKTNYAIYSSRVPIKITKRRGPYLFVCTRNQSCKHRGTRKLVVNKNTRADTLLTQINTMLRESNTYL